MGHGSRTLARREARFVLLAVRKSCATNISGAIFICTVHEYLWRDIYEPMAPAGRPPKAPEDRATAQLNVRFTEEERRRLDWLMVELRARSAGDVIKRAVAELYERVAKGRR